MAFLSSSYGFAIIEVKLLPFVQLQLKLSSVKQKKKKTNSNVIFHQQKKRNRNLVVLPNNINKTTVLEIHTFQMPLGTSP